MKVRGVREVEKKKILLFFGCLTKGTRLIQKTLYRTHEAKKERTLRNFKIPSLGCYFP